MELGGSSSEFSLRVTPVSLFSKIHGYDLVRLIGAGGFGDVWLARSVALDRSCAVKILRSGSCSRPDRELEAVRRFKGCSPALGAVALLPVEHVGRADDGRVFYVMPLADGTPCLSPDHPSWQPLTLGALIRQRAGATDRATFGRTRPDTAPQSPPPAWFGSAEIIRWLVPVARAAAALGEVGLLHRDIKPDNILFLRGRPLLADVSLLDADTLDRTELGTPGYRAPSWFTETGGNPDLYGLAATLYTSLTGHAPDKLGRAAYRWPPGGEASLSPAEHAEWLRLHRVILRATHERAAERFHSLTAFADALENRPSAAAPAPVAVAAPSRGSRVPRSLLLVGFAAPVLVLLALVLWQPKDTRAPIPAQTPASPPAPVQIAEPTPTPTPTPEPSPAPATDAHSLVNVQPDEPAAPAPGPESAMHPAFEPAPAPAAPEAVPPKPWAAFDTRLAESRTETKALEAEWETIQAAVRAELEKLKTLRRLDDIEAMVDRVTPLLRRGDDIHFDEIDRLRARWLDDQLPASLRAAIAADTALDGWKTAEAAKINLSSVDRALSTLKADTMSLLNAWKSVLQRYLEELQKINPEPAIQTRVLVLLEKFAPEYRIQKKLRESRAAQDEVAPNRRTRVEPLKKGPTNERN